MDLELSDPYAPSDCDNNSDRSTRVSNLIHRIETNYLRRKEELEVDALNNKTVCGKVVSSNLANIPGISKHLSTMKTVRMRNASAEVPDAYGHGTLRKGELYLKYTGK